jgi:predicted DNA-binding ribbon-helix-helix protein
MTSPLMAMRIKRIESEVEQLKKQNSDLRVLLVQWIKDADDRNPTDWDLVEASEIAVEESKCHA